MTFPQIVESVTPVQKRYKLISREAHPQNSTIQVRSLERVRSTEDLVPP